MQENGKYANVGSAWLRFFGYVAKMAAVVSKKCTLIHPQRFDNLEYTITVTIVSTDSMDIGTQHKI